MPTVGILSALSLLRGVPATLLAGTPAAVAIALIIAIGNLAGLFVLPDGTRSDKHFLMVYAHHEPTSFPAADTTGTPGLRRGARAPGA